MDGANNSRPLSRSSPHQQHNASQQYTKGADHLPNPSSSTSSSSGSYASPLTASLAKLDKENIDKEICHWNAAEEAVLVHALIKEQVEGRQVENGFKPQAWRNVYEVGQRKGVRPKTIEQLKSRWQRLKKEYRIVKNLRHVHGFLWDDESAVVVAESMFWETYLEKHPEAKPFRKKAFPLYDAISGLVERDGAPATPSESTNGNPTPWSQKQPHEEGSTLANTPPSGDDDDDEDDRNPSVVSGGKSWADRRRDQSVSDEEDRRPMEVAHIMHNFKNQDINPVPKLRQIRPAEFPTTMALPPINGIKRCATENHNRQSLPSSSDQNGHPQPSATTKRRRLDNPSGFCDNDATSRFSSQQQPSRLAHHLPQPRPMPPGSLFPSSSCIHHLSQSLDNLVACLSEIPVASSLFPNTSPLSSSPTNSRSHHANSWYERKRHAWDTVISEEALSEYELALARRVFRGNVELADEYLSFPQGCRGARTLWLRREIQELATRHDDP